MKVGLIRASLPSYFPQKHGIWDATQSALSALCEADNASLFVAPTIPMDARETLSALDDCRLEGVDFVLLLCGGFTNGGIHLGPARASWGGVCAS